MATWDEVRRLVGVMGEMNAGVFELAGEGVDRAAERPGAARLPHVRLRDLAVESGRPDHLRRLQPARRARRVAEVPGPARRDRGAGRAHVRPGAQPLAERAALVQDPDCRSIACRCGRSSARSRSSEQRRQLRDPEMRRRLIAASGRAATAAAPSAPRPAAADYDWHPRLRHRGGPAPHGGRGRARARPASGRDHDRPRAGEGSRPLLPAADRQRGPGRTRSRSCATRGTVTTFSDSGAHVSQLMDSSLQTPPAQPLGARQAGRSPSSRPCGC